MKGFCDSTTIEIHAGNGGDGDVSFYRTKGIPKGGPDGGDGGNGGSIIFKINKNLNTLSHLDSKKVFKAPPGGRGSQQNKHGKNGEDLVLEVPLGTLIYKASPPDKKGVESFHDSGGGHGMSINEDLLITDLSNPKMTFVAATGGRGGYGNAHFVSSVRQAPQFAEIGEEGETMSLRLELKLMADVAIIGIPSAGKSTLISVISNAKPKIADYPFTTLIPNLGVVTPFPEDKTKSMIVADIPGLIEGAAEGKGLGHEFLRHIERSRLIVHLIDPTQDNPIENFKKINQELEKFNPELAKRPQIVVINKLDAIDQEIFEMISKELYPLPSTNYRLFTTPISSATTENCKTLTIEIYKQLQKTSPIIFAKNQEPTENSSEYLFSSQQTDQSENKTQEEHKIFQPHLEDPKYWSAEEIIQPPIELQKQITHLTNEIEEYYEPEPEKQGKYDEPLPESAVKYFQVQGKRIEQIANMTDWNNKEARMRVEDVLRKMGIEKELLKLKANEDDIIIIGKKPMKFRPRRQQQ
jgi:GTPase